MKNQNNFDNGLCAIKFGATWCGPCKTLEPIMKKMEVEFSPSVNFYSIDVDSRPDLAKKYLIKSLPTVILLNDGRIANRIQGAVLTSPLRTAFKEFVAVKENAA